MALIAILLSLTLERLLGTLEGVRNFHWFATWSAWVHKQLPASSPWQGEAGLVVVLLPPLLLLVLVFQLLDGVWMPLSFLAGVMVLLYCMGPKDLEAEVEAFLEARERDDEESALWHAASLLGKALPENSRLLTRQLVENILIEANSRVIAVFFWFVLLGPFGALLYRLTAIYQRTDTQGENGLAEASRRLMGLLDWIPVRLCAIGYAMSGNFVEAIAGWRTHQAQWPESNREILVQSGLGALGQGEDGREEAEVPPEREAARISETIALVRRMALVLLVILALLTLGGWAS